MTSLSPTKTRPQPRLLPLLLLTTLLALGCGKADPRYTLTGQVSFNGEPIEQGEISFVPTEPNGTPDGGPIENGAYRVEVRPGKKKVSIRASRPVPAERQPTDGGVFYEDFLPARFNDESTLEIEVTAEGPHKLPFHLTDK